MIDPNAVAVYYRMSTNQQEDSIERQRSQVEPYCQAHGYTIVREYKDEGIAGDEILRRPAFQRMLKDAQAGLFRGIVCDDKDRFGRFDSLDLGEIAAPLRRKGVWLETVAQGRREWDSFAGRITDAVLQEAKSIELDATSRRVLTNQLLRARKGKSNGNPALYGYRWEADPNVGRKYVADGRKAEVVRLMFRLYDQGWTLAAIRDELYKRGVASPRGCLRWTRPAIQRILSNRRYCGDMTWGVHAQGKRHRYKGGDVRTTERGERDCHKNEAEHWVVCMDTHEPLVDRETFARVQARLRGNKTRTTPHPNGGEFVLSRLLVCGHCGHVLSGCNEHGKRIYVCMGYVQFGKDYCKRHWIAERPLVDFLIRKLQATYLDPDNLEKLRQAVAAQEARERGESNLRKLRRRLRDLEEKIDVGTERLMEVSREVVPALNAKLRERQQEKKELETRIRRLETESGVEDLERRIAAAENVLWRLQEAVQTEDFPLLRELLREMVSRVELRWTHVKKAKVTRCRLEGGVVYLRPDPQLVAVDMSIDIRKVEEPAGVPRMAITLNGKWLHYKKF